jgi:hypothetical protein
MFGFGAELGGAVAAGGTSDPATGGGTGDGERTQPRTASTKHAAAAHQP